MNATKEQIKMTLDTVRVIADAIRQLGGVPNGVLYAQVMPHMDFETYQRIIQTLKNCDLIKEEAHVLTWVGPKL
jgi:hypothetical protein